MKREGKKDGWGKKEAKIQAKEVETLAKRKAKGTKRTLKVV